MFKSLWNFIKKLLKWLLPILIIVLVIIAVFFPYLLPVIWAWVETAVVTVGGWLSSAWGTITSLAASAWEGISGWVASASIGDMLKMAAGAAIIINPQGAAKAAGYLLDTVGDVTGNLLSKIPSWVWLGIGAYAVYSFASNNGTTVKIEQERSDDV